MAVTISAEPLTPGARFQFGANWLRFLSVVNEQRISAAADKLSDWLGDIRGKSFLDIGCGSGIHSLAAVRLGASRVVSFDYDPQSVGCAQEMRRRFAPASDWRIEHGSALDERYLRSLGTFDVVYSWGVLHHTGNMWSALHLAGIPATKNVLIAIYNDQGGASRRWLSLKRKYNQGSAITKRMIEGLVWCEGWLQSFLIDCVRRQPLNTIRAWKHYSQERGMSPWHDVVDWAGGYPFEVAKPEQILDFFRARGLLLEKMTTCGGGKGCNEFLFSKPT